MSHKKLLKSYNSPPTSTTSDLVSESTSDSQRSSKEMSASAAASAAAIALALDLKPKLQPEHQQQQQQKIKKCALTYKPNRPFTRSLLHNQKKNSLRSARIGGIAKSCQTLTPGKTSFSCRSCSSYNSYTSSCCCSNSTSTTTTTIIKSSTSNSSVLTKEKFLFTLDLLAVVRRNASDKLKLIQMVHDNPILWDSRLPNFKGAEEEKNRAWEMIGKEFNAPGRRVARAFKSLRESYRRELAHVKLMGSNFKPKWSLYEAMDFLRDVIRERKGGSHAIEHSGPLGLNLSALAQHISNAAAANNNNSNHHNNNKNNYNKLNSLHSSFNDSALNLSKCSSSLNVSGDDYYYYVKSELDLSNQNTNPNAVGQQQQHQHQQQQQQQQQAAAAAALVLASNLTPAHQHHQTTSHATPQTNQQQQQQNDSRVSSTRNDSTAQNNTYDDLDNSSMRSGDDTAALSNQGSDEVEELEAIDADFPYPLILNSNSPTTSGANGAVGGPPLKRRRKHLNSTGEEDNDGEADDDDEDDYDGQMLQQHRHLRAQNMANGLTHNGLMAGGLMGDMMPPPQTVREVLNSKFCGFISAKLNSMDDTEADNLMNKILMLLVQTQMNTAAAAAAAVGVAASSSPSATSVAAVASTNEAK